MNEKILDEIAQLDKEFDEGKPETEINPTTEEESEEESEVEEQETEEESEEESEVEKGLETGSVEKVDAPEKPTKESKQNFAFAQLRNENKQNKELINQLVELYGFKDETELRSKLEATRIKKEAEKQGVSQEVYKRMSENEKRIKDLEEERTINSKNNQIAQVKASLDETVKELGLSADDQQAVLNKLDKEGYTVDDLIATKNVKRLFKSVAGELSLGKNPSGLDTRNVSKSHKENDDSLETLLDEEMKEYAKRRGYKL